MITLTAIATFGLFLMAFMVMLSAAEDKLEYAVLDKYATRVAITLTAYMALSGLIIGAGVVALVPTPLRYLAVATVLTYACFFVTPAQIWRATGWSGLVFNAVLVGVMVVCAGLPVLAKLGWLA